MSLPSPVGEAEPPAAETTAAPRKHLPKQRLQSEPEAAVPVATVPRPAEVSEGEASKLAPEERLAMYSDAPEMTIDPGKFYYATFKTDKGDIKVQLFADRAPETVNNFVFLAQDGFYNDTTFHRVLDAFMAQGGDPTGTGSGGPGYQFADEFYPGGVFDRPGLLAMANAGPGTNGSQFFITYEATPWLNNQHTIFGEVVEGQDVLDALTLRDPNANPTEPGDTLYTVLIEEGGSSELPTPTPLPPTPTPFPPSALEGGERPLAEVDPADRANYFNTEPEMVIDPEKSYQATITTSQGDLVVELYSDLAPVAVNNFVVLSNLGFYDNTPINDVSPGQLVVVGAPDNNPASDAGYLITPEVNLDLTPAEGAVAYRSLSQADDGSVVASSSQLFLAITAPPADSNASYSFFGKVIEGLELLPLITVDDTIESITIQEVE